jgi:hypothetical protein
MYQYLLLISQHTKYCDLTPECPGQADILRENKTKLTGSSTPFQFRLGVAALFKPFAILVYVTQVGNAIFS